WAPAYRPLGRHSIDRGSSSSGNHNPGGRAHVPVVTWWPRPPSRYLGMSFRSVPHRIDGYHHFGRAVEYLPRCVASSTGYFSALPQVSQDVLAVAYGRAPSGTAVLHLPQVAVQTVHRRPRLGLRALRLAAVDIDPRPGRARARRRLTGRWIMSFR